MDFDFSDDQLALQSGARELLAGLASPATVRRFSELDGADNPYDRVLWNAMVEQGWLGLAFGEDVGGLGLGTVELAILLEALGAHTAPVPFTSTVLAAALVDGADKLDALAALLSGGAVGCIAWSKRPNAVFADGRGEGLQLTGRTDPVLYASAANVAIVVALVGDEPHLFAVSLDDVGRPPREPAMDLTRPVAWLRFEGTPAHHLGGPDAVAALVDDGATLTACEMLGGAQRVLDMTVEYAKDRVQFDRPIGSFQAVKHRCADMLVDVEGMRSTAYWAAWSLGADDDASIAASTAKCWASDASKRVMASGLQVHGGIGFTWEHDLHFYMKRAQLDQLTFGDAGYHRQRLAGLLRPRVVAGDSVV